MALAIQQEVSICGFNVHFSLNMCAFVEQLSAQKWKLAITLRFHGELKRGMARVYFSRKLTADVMSSTIVSVSSTYLL